MIDAIALTLLMIGVCIVLASASMRPDDAHSSEPPSYGFAEVSRNAGDDLDLKRYREAYYAAWQARRRNIRLNSYSDEIRIGYDECSSIARTLKPEQTLDLKRVPSKPGDPHCVSASIVTTSGEVELGHLPEDCSASIAAQMDRGARFNASVDRIEIHGPLRQFVSIYISIHRISEPVAQQDWS